MFCLHFKKTIWLKFRNLKASVLYIVIQNLNINYIIKPKYKLHNKTHSKLELFKLIKSSRYSLQNHWGLGDGPKMCLLDCLYCTHCNIFSDFVSCVNSAFICLLLYYYHKNHVLYPLFISNLKLGMCIMHGCA